MNNMIRVGRVTQILPAGKVTIQFPDRDDTVYNLPVLDAAPQPVVGNPVVCIFYAGGKEGVCLGTFLGGWPE